MSSSITLDAKEKSKVKKAIRNSSNKVLCSAQARIYYAYASTRQWCYAGLQGALAVVRNKQDKTLHFQLVDLDGTGGVIWEYEIHDGLLVEREKSATFFLSFEGDKFPIGFVFLDDSEATKVHRISAYWKSCQNGRPTLPASSSRPAPRIHLPSEAHRKTPLPDIQDEQLHSLPRRQTTPSKCRPSSPPLRSSLLRFAPLPFPKLSEPKESSTEAINPHYSDHESLLFSTAPVPPDLISDDRPISSSVIPSHESSLPSQPIPIQRQSQPVDLDLPYEDDHEDQTELYMTPESNQTTQLPSPSPNHGASPWIIGFRSFHAPKKPVDTQFVACMANLRQQINHASSAESTPPGSLMGDRVVSIASSIFSQSRSIASPPPIVDFLPTPIFKDEIPAELLREFVNSSPIFSSTSGGFIDESWS